jgi:hypothetical protein
MHVQQHYLERGIFREHLNLIFDAVISIKTTSYANYQI